MRDIFCSNLFLFYEELCDNIDFQSKVDYALPFFKCSKSDFYCIYLASSIIHIYIYMFPSEK